MKISAISNKKLFWRTNLNLEVSGSSYSFLYGLVSGPFTFVNDTKHAIKRKKSARASILSNKFGITFHGIGTAAASYKPCSKYYCFDKIDVCLTVIIIICLDNTSIVLTLYAISMKVNTFWHKLTKIVHQLSFQVHAVTNIYI